MISGTVWILGELALLRIHNSFKNFVHELLPSLMELDTKCLNRNRKQSFPSSFGSHVGLNPSRKFPQNPSRVFFFGKKSFSFWQKKRNQAAYFGLFKQDSISKCAAKHRFLQNKKVLQCGSQTTSNMEYLRWNAFLRGWKKKKAEQYPTVVEMSAFLSFTRCCGWKRNKPCKEPASAARPVHSSVQQPFRSTIQASFTQRRDKQLTHPRCPQERYLQLLQTESVAQVPYPTTTTQKKCACVFRCAKHENDSALLVRECLHRRIYSARRSFCWSCDPKMGTETRQRGNGQFRGQKSGGKWLSAEGGLKRCRGQDNVMRRRRRRRRQRRRRRSGSR